MPNATNIPPVARSQVCVTGGFARKRARGRVVGLLLCRRNSVASGATLLSLLCRSSAAPSGRTAAKEWITGMAPYTGVLGGSINGAVFGGLFGTLWELSADQVQRVFPARRPSTYSSYNYTSHTSRDR
jgi:hypothetical protein